MIIILAMAVLATAGWPGPESRADYRIEASLDPEACELTGRVEIDFTNGSPLPVDTLWLQRLTTPLVRDGRFAAVQGGIREVPDLEHRFFWDSCGGRFYFTKESTRWISAHQGIGFSTVNAALRRSAWEAIPFGWAPIMEDKKWQRQARDAGLEIAACPRAAVFHTHDYDLPSLVRRCVAEGYGWRYLGEPYLLKDALADLLAPGILKELARGLANGRARSPAEILFPWLRPLTLYWGSRWHQPGMGAGPSPTGTVATP